MPRRRSPFAAQLSVLNFERTAVIPDSFVGYFPPSTESPLINQFGYCDTDIISPSLVADCKADKLLFKDIVNDALAQNSEIPFAYINSKEDAVQIGYYVAIAATSGRNVVSFEGTTSASTDNIRHERQSDVT